MVLEERPVLNLLPMARLSSLFACMLLALMLGLGSVAHAVETTGCASAAEAAEGVSGVHVDGDEDQVPSDAAKAYPHHHASCHGHHLASPCAEAVNAARRVQLVLPARQPTPVLASAFAHLVLQPPQA
jgi:hypothetical protein